MWTYGWLGSKLMLEVVVHVLTEADSRTGGAELKENKKKGS